MAAKCCASIWIKWLLLLLLLLLFWEDDEGDERAEAAAAVNANIVWLLNAAGEAALEDDEDEDVDEGDRGCDGIPVSLEE